MTFTRITQNTTKGHWNIKRKVGRMNYYCYCEFKMSLLLYSMFFCITVHWFKDVILILWPIRGSYSARWSIPLTNVKWHSDPWPTVTSQPIRLSTNFMTLIPNLTSPIMSGFHGAFAAGVASQQGTLTLPDTWFSPTIVGLACAQIVETRFLELVMSLLDISPRIPLGTFSILLSFNCINAYFSGRIRRSEASTLVWKMSKAELPPLWGKSKNSRPE